jgi:hypothetical protein
MNKFGAQLDGNGEAFIQDAVDSSTDSLGCLEYDHLDAMSRKAPTRRQTCCAGSYDYDGSGNDGFHIKVQFK